MWNSSSIHLFSVPLILHRVQCSIPEAYHRGHKAGNTLDRVPKITGNKIHIVTHTGQFRDAYQPTMYETWEKIYEHRQELNPYSIGPCCNLSYYLKQEKYVRCNQ